MNRFHSVGIVLSPSSECGSVRDGAGAWVINHFVEHDIIVACVNVVWFDINGFDRGSVCLMEIDCQSGFRTGFGHDIHRERVSRESDGAVLGHHGAHELGAVGPLVVDVEELAVHELPVSEGHKDRVARGWLPFAAAVGDGDVVGRHRGLPVGGGGLHRHGGHIGGHRQVAGHGETLRVVATHVVLTSRRRAVACQPVSIPFEPQPSDQEGHQPDHHSNLQGRHFDPMC